MKRPITLAVDEYQYNILFTAILSRIEHNSNEIHTRCISPKTVDLITHENASLENLLRQIYNEHEHVFK